MRQTLWALLLLTVGDGCAMAQASDIGQLQVQASQEKQAEWKSLDAPAYMAMKAPANLAAMALTLDACEKKFSPVMDAEHAAPSPPVFEPAWLGKARSLMRQREPDQAMQLLLKMVREDAKNTLVWREMARILDSIGRRETALGAWEQVLALSPNDVEATTGMGLDYVASKKFQDAVAKLFLSRRLWLTVEPTNARLKMQIATSAGLGLALRELNYAQAAATCFHEASQFEMALIQNLAPEEKAVRSQTKEFLRFAGECEAAIGQWDVAAESFTLTLAGVDALDATSLPPVIWALTCSGRPAQARQLIMSALATTTSPGQAGAPNAVAWLAKNGFSEPIEGLLQEATRNGVSMDAGNVGRSNACAQTVMAARCVLACGNAGAADFIFAAAPQVLNDPIAMREFVELHAVHKGVEDVVQLALAQVQTHPMSAVRWAAALRAVPMAAEQLRALIQISPTKYPMQDASIHDATRALLQAWFDLCGFDSLLALHTIMPFIESQDVIGSAARIVALKALAIEQDLAEISHIASLCDATSTDESVALSVVFQECEETEKAIEWAEKAIALDKKSAQAWMARAAIDTYLALDQSSDRTFEQRKEAAIEARNSLERALDFAPDNRMAARKFLEVAAPDHSIAPDEDAMEIVKSSASAQVQREYRREKALSSQRKNQSEAALESLRLLFIEDPCDAIVGQALLSASADLGRLPETEKFLDALVLSHRAAAELGEVDASCKARQGRLLEVVDILKSACAADPESDALVRGCVRSLVAAGNKSQAWSVMMNASKRVRYAAGRSQLERIEFAMSIDPNAAAAELRSLCADKNMTKLQRKSAVLLAHQLPKNIDDRLALQSALAKPLLDDAKVQPMYVAYAMLDQGLEQALALAQKHARAWPLPNTIEAAQLLADEGMFMRAEYLLNAVGMLSKDKNKAKLFRAELACIIAKGNVKKAIMRLTHERESNQFRIKDPRVTSAAEDLAELGNIFLLASDSVAAQECFQAAIDLSPDLSSAMNNLAWLRMERNDIDLVTVDLVKRALAATPHDPSTLDTAGWLAYRQGKLLDTPAQIGALSLLHESLQIAGNRASVESMDHYADALFQVGRTDESLKLWRLIAQQGVNTSSRENTISAFELVQQKEWGIRVWSGDEFYNHNDGAAILRAKNKLKAISQGAAPDVAEMDFAQDLPTAQSTPSPASDTLRIMEPSTTPEGAK